MSSFRKPLTIGVNLWPQDGAWSDYREAVQAADRAGIDSAWTWDHLYAIGERGEALAALAAALKPHGSDAADDETSWVGPPERIAERWRPFAEAGVTFAIADLMPPFDRETIERLPEVRALLEGG